MKDFDTTTERKVGAMMFLGWAGEGDPAGVNDHAREIVEEIGVGGVYMMPRNVAGDLRVTADTLNRLQGLSEEPLLVACDQEGGMTARFINGVSIMPSNMALGATGRPELARRAAAVTARELRAIGVNFNGAPCVDVNNNPDNPIVGTRSFGGSARRVAAFAAEAVGGYRDGGLIACAKHFPGSGDSNADSHLELPSVPHSRRRLGAVELKPFRAALAAGVPAVMTTHYLFPAIDPERPASLSPSILTGLLRRELGFDGVIVTDCLEMKAVAATYGTPESAVLAIEAGSDMVLICHTPEVQRASREAILKAVRSGRIPESRLDESIARIRALKQAYRLQQRRWADPEALAGILRRPEHVAVQRKIEEDAVTLIRNRDRTIPLKPDNSRAILVTGFHPTVGPLADAVRNHAPRVTAMPLSAEDPEAIERAAAAATTAAAAVVATCRNEPFQPPLDQVLQAQLVRKLAGRIKNLAVTAVREPYDISAFPDVPACICTYGYRGGSLAAAAGVLFGTLKARGRLPVVLPKPGLPVNPRRSAVGDTPAYW